MLDKQSSASPHVVTLFPSAPSPQPGGPVTALISMPFATLRRPSIQIGLLKAIGEQHGFDVEAFHLNLDFVSELGVPLYEVLTEYRGRMLGDWMFGRAAFGKDRDPDPEAMFAERFKPEVDLLLEKAEATLADLLRLRNQTLPDYLDQLVERYCWEEFDVFGFTSTFQQNAASIAMARRLKAAYPDTINLFGGANFEGDMGEEMLRSIPDIDYAVSGEADAAFPGFLRAVADKRDPATVPGVIHRSAGQVITTTPSPPFDEFDSSPVPDYFDFFDRAEDLGLLTGKGRRRVLVPFEGSRGCWWGAKQHCTFCGLNGRTMSFRSKSPERVEAEVNELARRHKSFDFQAVDNIMDMDLLDGLFRTQVDDELHHQFFFEVKSNLSRSQIAAMSAGGLFEVQPGIESLSTPVLRLMQKGVTAAQNVNMLRWCLYYGINVNWNLLWGFPGETEEMYADELAILRKIPHLQPPVGVTRIWMERFSPIYTQRERFPVSRPIEAEPSYRYVYPDGTDVEKVAYFFDYALERTLGDGKHDDTDEQIKAWLTSWKTEDKPRPTLIHLRSRDVLSIEDARDPDARSSWLFEPPLADIYLACSDRPVSAANVAAALGLDWPVEELTWALDAFVEKGLMLRDETRYLALSVPAMRRR